MRESRSPPPFNEEPQISKDFWGFLVFFLPADLFLLRCFFFSLNISLSRRFRRWRRFFLIDYLSPTDFTDLHRFFSLIIFLMDLHGFSLVLFFFLSFLYFADFRTVGLGFRWFLRLSQLFEQRYGTYSSKVWFFMELIPKKYCFFWNWCRKCLILHSESTYFL